MFGMQGRRAGVIVGVVALVSTLFAAGGAPSGAATKNPCKVLKKSENAAAFGGTVGTPEKGLTTPVSAQCDFAVGATADRPEGTVTVTLMTTGARAAYTGLKKMDLYVPIAGVPNSLYAEKLHVVNLLKGAVLLGVQGNFIVTDPLPLHFVDVKTQLTDLAKIGIKRV